MLKTALHIKRNFSKSRRLAKYHRRGCIPWSEGYLDYRNDFICSILSGEQNLARFRQKKNLPSGYGERLDERVIEYPWIFARLDASASLLLDVGSTLNQRFILEHPLLSKKRLVIYTLASEWMFSQDNVSYIYGDLRETILLDAIFDEIACISTIEHIGMDNTMLYTGDEQFDEANTDDYQVVLKEFRRLLKPGGRLCITVPYGRYQNIGWMQQFDGVKLEEAINVFGGTIRDQTFYKYNADGWQIAEAAECADCEYYNIHARNGFDPDYAAAARAVACVELVK